jgi:hypothetical protein
LVSISIVVTTADGSLSRVTRFPLAKLGMHRNTKTLTQNHFITAMMSRQSCLT